eukprot:2542106-Prymnesium_polylepis.1
MDEGGGDETAADFGFGAQTLGCSTVLRAPSVGRPRQGQGRRATCLLVHVGYRCNLLREHDTLFSSHDFHKNFFVAPVSCAHIRAHILHSTSPVRPVFTPNLSRRRRRLDARPRNRVAHRARTAAADTWVAPRPLRSRSAQARPAGRALSFSNEAPAAVKDVDQGRRGASQCALWFSFPKPRHAPHHQPRVSGSCAQKARQPLSTACLLLAAGAHMSEGDR